MGLSLEQLAQEQRYERGCRGGDYGDQEPQDYVGGHTHSPRLVSQFITG